MKFFNQLVAVGYVTHVNEPILLNDGTMVLSFGVRINSPDITDTTWIEVSAYDKLAEILAEYLSPKRWIFFSGTLILRKKDKSLYPKVTLREIVFLEKKPSDASQLPLNQPDQPTQPMSQPINQTPQMNQAQVSQTPQINQPQINQPQVTQPQVNQPQPQVNQPNQPANQIPQVNQPEPQMQPNLQMNQM